MEGHCDVIQRSNRWMLRLVGLAAMVLLFSTSMYVAYVYTAQEPVSAATQVSAVTESLSKGAFANLSLQAKSAAVIDTTTLVTEYAFHADVQLPLASLTKVPLMLAISEVLPLESIVTIEKDTVPSSTAGIVRAGSHWKVRDLVAYTLVASSNDGASILAGVADEPLRQRYPQAQNNAAAVWRMNDLMRELELPSIYFLNPTGLDESATQAGAYGSARDIATLFSYAARTHPDLFDATTKDKIDLVSEDGHHATALNTDDALDSLGAIVMGKTGYTDLAGGNLAIVFDAHGHRYVAVVLGSTKSGRFTDMRQLIRTVQNGTLVRQKS